MDKRIFALFVLILFLTPSVVFAQEGTALDLGGSAPSDSGSSEPSSGGGGSSDSGSSEPSSGGGGSSDSGISEPFLGGGGEGFGDVNEPPRQNQCPQGLCMKGEDCVPCPSDDFRGGPMGNVPPGCHVEKGEFGDFVECEKRDEGFGDMEKRCREDGGVFHKTERGPECSFENKGGGGFFGAPKCPDDLKEAEERCSSSGGKPDRFIDRAGCKIVSCNYGNQGRGNFEDVKDDPRECESRGGKFVILKGEPRCFTSDDQVRIKENLDEIEPTDLLKIALKLENILKSLEEIGKK